VLLDQGIIAMEGDRVKVQIEGRLFSQLSGWKIACDGLETP